MCVWFFFTKSVWFHYEKSSYWLKTEGSTNIRPSFCKDCTKKAASRADKSLKTHHINPFSVICHALLIILLAKWVYLLVFYKISWLCQQRPRGDEASNEGCKGLDAKYQLPPPPIKLCPGSFLGLTVQPCGEPCGFAAGFDFLTPQDISIRKKTSCI
jgi:hypothetical protein